MTFKPAVWYPIAVALSAINVIAIGFTAGPNQLMHASSHAALAVAFGFWARRLRPAGGTDFQARLEALEAEASRLEALEGEVGQLRRELGEAQERLDFAERVLVKAPEARREEP